MLTKYNLYHRYRVKYALNNEYTSAAYRSHQNRTNRVTNRNRTKLCHIELLKIDSYIIPVSLHAPSAAPRCVDPLCGPLQQEQQQHLPQSVMYELLNIKAPISIPIYIYIVCVH